MSKQIKEKQSIDGKLQPQSVELENAVLGAILLEKESLSTVINILTPDCFYRKQNNIIYNAILNLYKRSDEIDLLTVKNELQRLGKLEDVGGAYYVSTLTNNVASSANIEHHSRIIVECYLKREFIRICNEGIEKAYSIGEDVFDTFSFGIQKLESAVSNVIKYDVSVVKDIHYKILADSLLILKSGKNSGVPSGYKQLDNVTNGFQKSDLIILGGRSGNGKTATTINCMLNASIKQNIPTALFSLEMSKEQCVGRMQSILSGITASRIIKKQLTQSEIKSMDTLCLNLVKAPIYIDDTPSISLLELKQKARKLVKDKGVQIIYIDYLQLMRSGMDSFNREQEVANISKGLKALAKELDIPIVALSQIGRAVDHTSDKKPTLAALRESGQIENDADLVIMCYRPERYGIETYEINGREMSTSGLYMLLIEKHRSGELGEIPLHFTAELMKLDNYSYDNNYENNFTNQNNSYTFVQSDIHSSISENSNNLTPNKDFFEGEKDLF